MRRLRLPTSNEERVAKNIGKLLSDYSLDLEQVGKYLVVANPHLIYSRALEVLESAQFNNEMGKYYDEKLF